jgi:TolA-binding protein
MALTASGLPAADPRFQEYKRRLQSSIGFAAALSEPWATSDAGIDSKPDPDRDIKQELGIKAEFDMQVKSGSLNGSRKPMSMAAISHILPILEPPPALGLNAHAQGPAAASLANLSVVTARAEQLAVVLRGLLAKETRRRGSSMSSIPTSGPNISTGSTGSHGSTGHSQSQSQSQPQPQSQSQMQMPPPGSAQMPGPRSHSSLSHGSQHGSQRSSPPSSLTSLKRPAPGEELESVSAVQGAHKRQDTGEAKGGKARSKRSMSRSQSRGVDGKEMKEGKDGKEGKEGRRAPPPGMLHLPSGIGAVSPAAEGGPGPLMGVGGMPSGMQAGMPNGGIANGGMSNGGMGPPPSVPSRPMSSMSQHQQQQQQHQQTQQQQYQLQQQQYQQQQLQQQQSHQQQQPQQLQHSQQPGMPAQSSQHHSGQASTPSMHNASVPSSGSAAPISAPAMGGSGPGPAPGLPGPMPLQMQTYIQALGSVQRSALLQQASMICQSRVQTFTSMDRARQWHYIVQCIVSVISPYCVLISKDQRPRLTDLLLIFVAIAHAAASATTADAACAVCEHVPIGDTGAAGNSAGPVPANPPDSASATAATSSPSASVRQCECCCC